MEKDLIKVDACIVGGSVIGLWTGLELAKQGKKIIIIDKTHIGSIKNNIDACLNFPNNDYMADLISKSQGKWLQLKKESPEYLNIDIKGCLSFALNKNQQQHLQDLHELQNDANQDSGSFILNDRKAIKTLLDANELGEEVISALVNVADIGLDNQNCLDFLRNNLIKAGAQFWGSDEVMEFNFSNDKIENIETKESIIQAENFIIAAGAKSKFLVEQLGLHMPIRPARTHIIEYTSKAKLPKQMLHFKNNFGEYISKPMLNGRNLLIYTGVNDQMQSTWSNNVDQTSITSTILEMIRILPILSYADVQNYQAISLAVTPDRAPYFGKTKFYKNLYLNIGHNGLNYLLAPYLAEQMANLIQGKNLSSSLSFLSPDRFMPKDYKLNLSE